MVTGASTADLALVLIDARNGIVQQSRRHAFIASLLRIPHIVVCINKMDLVDWSEDVYNRIADEFTDFAARLEVSDVQFIPVSALKGDNVVDRSENMPWYEGSPLLYHLEHVHIASDRNLIDVRFPVQWVVRPGTEEFHDYRGYAGQVASGVLRPGDDVVVLPSGAPTKVQRIDTFDGPVEEAYPPMSVTVHLADDLDVSRGDMISRPHNQPVVSRDVDAIVCWMSETPVREGARLYPQNVNISAAAAIAGLGLDRTRVVIVADPTITTHLVELEAKGAFGRFTFREDVAVSDENRKTGKLVAMAMVKSVRQLASTLVVAA
jgi:bifunctional enzyme CysN/CysC